MTSWTPVNTELQGQRRPFDSNLFLSSLDQFCLCLIYQKFKWPARWPTLQPERLEISLQKYPADLGMSFAWICLQVVIKNTV